MKKLFLGLMILFACSAAYAQEYTANTWASWASVTSQINWKFPYNSRSISIFNGSAVPICATFNNSVTIDSSCTSTGTNGVFQVPATSNRTFLNITRQGVSIRSASTAASPVSVMVQY